MANTERPFVYENEGMRPSNYVYYVSKWGFLLKLNCPYAVLIDRVTERMVQAGIVDKVIYDYLIMPAEKVRISMKKLVNSDVKLNAFNH